MKIKTKLFLSVLFFVFLFCTIILIVFINTEKANQAEKSGRQFEQIVKEILDLNTLTNDYFLYHEERAYQQWQIQYKRIGQLLNAERFSSPQDQEVFNRLTKDYTNIGEKFSQFIQIYQNRQKEIKQEDGTTPPSLLEKQMVVQLLTLSRSIVNESNILAESKFADRVRIRRNTDITVFFLISILLLTVIGTLAWFYRSVMSPINKLQEGIQVIATGNLDYKIFTKTHDEIGSIARAFNEMTTKLRASFIDLQKFKMAVEFAFDQIIITDPEGIVVYANKYTEAITGYTIGEAVGKKAGSLWGGYMDKTFYEHMWHAIKAEKKTFVGELTNKRKNGKTYITEIHISPVFDTEKNILFFVSLERDISQMKAIDKAKTEFVAVGSHALRTPLGAIKWYLEVIQSDVDFSKVSPNLQKYILEISKNNARLLNLVHNLLAISRIDQGKIDNSPDEVNISDLLKDKIDKVKTSANKNNISFDLTLPEDHISPIVIDRLKLEEVIDNLLSNAIIYNKPKGKVDILVERKKDVLSIAIKDTGFGLADEDKKSLFTKFFRSAKAITSNPDGTGLGLYVVKAYVENWGGTISVESQEDKGSTFSLTLPMNGWKNTAL